MFLIAFEFSVCKANDFLFFLMECRRVRTSIRFFCCLCPHWDDSPSKVMENYKKLSLEEEVMGNLLMGKLVLVTIVYKVRS